MKPTYLLPIIAATGVAFVAHAETPAETSTDVSPSSEVDAVGETNIEVLNLEKTPFSGSLDTSHLISAAVYNLQEETIGNIDQLIVNPTSGQIEKAVVSVGGFLGIGDHLVAVPWSDFQVMKVRDADETATTDSTSEDATLDAEAEEIAATDAETENADNADPIEVDESNPEEVVVTKTAESAEIRLYLDTNVEKLKEMPEYNPEANAVTWTDSTEAEFPETAAVEASE